MNKSPSYILFDLDGVLVDNVAYERAVTSLIIEQISLQRRVSLEEARLLWDSTLADHMDDPRWHDYGFHCSALGVPEAWRGSHKQMRHLLRPMPRAIESLETCRTLANCWLASDATDWVVSFKLKSAGFDASVFQEIFTLDRCHAGKGDRKYWTTLRTCMGHTQRLSIYVDNRLDRLVVAAAVLPNCRLVHVTTADHPLSLQLFPEVTVPSTLPITSVASIDLPEVLRAICEDTTSL